MTTAKDAFLLHLDQPAELVALLEHDDINYVVWTWWKPIFEDHPYNVSVFRLDAPNIKLMRSSEYDLTMVEAMTLVADLMRGVTI